MIKTSDEIADLCDQHNVRVAIQREIKYPWDLDGNPQWRASLTLQDDSIGLVSTDSKAPSLDSAMCQAWEKLERLIRTDNSGTFLKELPAPEERPNDYGPLTPDPYDKDEVPF